MDLLEGEYAASGLSVIESESAGRSYVASNALSAGETIVAARGFLFPPCDTPGESLAQLVTNIATAAGLSTSDAQLATLARNCLQLCPTSTSPSPRLRRKCDDASALHTLKEATGIDESRLQSIFFKVSRNAFDNGVFPRAALFNHSCQPNCGGRPSHMDDDGMLGTHDIFALADIAAGSELFISYLTDDDLLLPRDNRREKLADAYGFECRCERCESDGDGVQDSRETTDSDAQLVALLSQCKQAEVDQGDTLKAYTLAERAVSFASERPQQDILRVTAHTRLFDTATQLQSTLAHPTTHEQRDEHLLRRVLESQVQAGHTLLAVHERVFKGRAHAATAHLLDTLAYALRSLANPDVFSTPSPCTLPTAALTDAATFEDRALSMLEILD